MPNDLLSQAGALTEIPTKTENMIDEANAIGSVAGRIEKDVVAPIARETHIPQPILWGFILVLAGLGYVQFISFQQAGQYATRADLATSVAGLNAGIEKLADSQAKLDAYSERLNGLADRINQLDHEVEKLTDRFDAAADGGRAPAKRGTAAN